MKNENGRVSLIPFIAGVLILIRYFLAYGVTPPVNNGLGLRYLFYWTLLVISGIGTNLLALYLGYTAQKSNNPWRNISRAAFYSVSLGLIAVIWSIAAYHSYSIKDLWHTWLPIVTNQYPFAAALLIWYILGPILAKHIEIVTQSVRHVLSICLIWFVLVLPFIFFQPLWGISNGNNLIWVGTLFILGLLASRGELQWVFNWRKSVPLAIFCVLAVFVRAKLIPITQTATALSGRFFSNYQLNIAILSLVTFGVLVSFFGTWDNKTKRWSWPSWYALLAYLTSCLSVVNYHLGTSLHVGITESGRLWLTEVVIKTIILVLIVGLITLFLAYISKISFIKRLFNYFPIQKSSDIFNFSGWVNKMFRQNFRLLLVVLLGFLLTFTQMLIINQSTTYFSWNSIQYIFVELSGQLLLNIIIFLCAFLLFYSLVNRYWPALMFTSGLSIFIAIAEFLKISLREEPILPTDLGALSAASDILKMISPVVIVVSIIILAILIIMSILLQRHIGGMYPRKSGIVRIVTCIIMMVFFGSFYFVNRAGTLPNIIAKGFGVRIQYYDQTGGAKRNGPIVQFAINLDTKIMAKPDGYSKDKINQIMNKYDNIAKKINKTRHKTLKNQTVLFVLSESFSDPNRVPKLNVSPNPLPYLTSLKKHTNSGLMLSQGYGGGTANMEWQSLTGLSLSNLSPTLPTPYTQLVPKQKKSPAFTNLFNTKIAIHPYNASLYNRKEVFKKFGFQKFYYQGSQYKLKNQRKLGTSSYVSDSSAYKDTLQVIKQGGKKSKFIQLSTMQNHMPFNNYYKNAEKFALSGSAYNNSKTDSVETYVQGVNYTDKALKQFIQQVDKIKKPITIVWYGDHLASLYTSKLMDQYPIQLHETDYFVYSNQNHKLSYTNRLVSPYAFPALALSATDTKVTPYYALVTKVTDDLPAMTIDPSGTTVNGFNGSNIFVGQNSKEIKYTKLSKYQKQLFHDYKLIQYDLVAGKQYSAHWAEQKVKN